MFLETINGYYEDEIISRQKITKNIKQISFCSLIG